LGAIFCKRARTYLVVVGIIFYLLSTRAIGNFLLLPFEKPYNHKHTPQTVDAMVILSGGNHGKSANLTLGYSSFKRLIYGVMIAKKENIPIIYSGGGIQKYNEATSTKDTIYELNNYLDMNLTETKIIKSGFSIFYEDKSLNTYENAKLTKEIFAKNSIKTPTIYLVTSAFHMKRSYKLYNYFGFKVIPVATDFFTTKGINSTYFFPSIKGLKMSYYALHEYVGLLQLSMKLK
jgi:uncharacterized SAM-binding protein YcdF (DUF218 family)